MQQKIRLLLILLLVGTFCCQAQTPHKNKPSDPSLIKGKGVLSFKLNGKLYRSNPLQTKCWSSNSVPLAVLWARGDGIDISWQIQHLNGKGVYQIDQDSSGLVNFTIAEKIYWVRKTDGSNYLHITVTSVKDKYNLKLLSGVFEGVLEDKQGNKVRITEGRFTTEDI